MVEFKEINDYNFPFEVGVLPSRELAYKFVDFLTTKGIKAQAKAGFGANYIIYVALEKDVSPAKLELLRFGNNPFAKAYNQASWSQGRVLKRQKSVSSGFMGAASRYGWSPFTLTSVIEIVCLVIFVLMSLSTQMQASLAQALGWYNLASLTQGFEIYRLITPIFLHFGILHIAFNLVMFEAFGRPIERHLGLGKLLFIVLTIAVVSNSLQFFVDNHPASLFGGMSGVVYGLICYMGILSRRPDLPDALKVPPGLLTVSLIFVAIGFLMNNVANYCHLGGLAMGAVLALLDFKRPLKIRG